MIGIFDSGAGGLTVLKAIRKIHPTADLIYLGDTARLPYGEKSAENVQRYSEECARFLALQGATTIVVACNTASAVALDLLKENYDVYGVIEPAAKACQDKRIGVIATEGTIASGAYERALNGRSVITRACPLLVPIVEERLWDHPIADAAAHGYLAEFQGQVDALILGCTHYPLLKRAIKRALNVELIESGDALAHSLPKQIGGGTTRYFVTDRPDRFGALGAAYLGADAKLEVSLVQLD